MHRRLLYGRISVFQPFGDESTVLYSLFNGPYKQYIMYSSYSKHCCIDSFMQTGTYCLFLDIFLYQKCFLFFQKHYRSYMLSILHILLPVNCDWLYECSSVCCNYCLQLTWCYNKAKHIVVDIFYILLLHATRWHKLFSDTLTAFSNQHSLWTFVSLDAATNSLKDIQHCTNFCREIPQ